MTKMTEEIIIDGVDVAGCEHHLSTGYCQLQMIFQGMVLKLPFGKHLECNLCDKDCYYKQLKRLEQENFALTQESQQKSQTICELEQENKELKEKIIELSEEKGHLIVENNTLKESNQSLSMLGTDLASANETVRKEFFRADKNKDMWREKAENYRSALEKIKNILNETLETHRITVALARIRDIIDEVFKYGKA